MSKKIDSIRIPLYAKVAASVTGILSSEPIKPHRSLVCQSIAFKNATGARGTITLQIDRGGTKIELGDFVSPTANVWYYYPYEQHLTEGERIEISQASCLQNDELSMRVVGYIEDMD